MCARLSNKIMKIRTIKKLFPAQLTLEGAGVRLHRGFGYREVPLFDPFLLLDDFGSNDPDDYLAGFPWHPHRGIETVTYVIKGKVEHQDSLGNKGVINDGDIQWMTAGSGIIHQEMPQRYEGATKAFQLWVNLPKTHKMMPPRYRGITGKEIPVVEDDTARVKVIAGKYRNTGGVVTDLVVPTTYLDIELKKGREFTYEVPAEFNLFLYVFEGVITVEDHEPVGESIVVLTNDGDTAKVRTTGGPARFILVAGMPLREPVAWYGPMVMNTDAEIKQALEEFRNGTFVKKQP